MNPTKDRKILRIAVGTTNPCKIKAVDIAIRRFIGNNRIQAAPGNNDHSGGCAATTTTTTAAAAAAAAAPNHIVELDVRGCNVESNVSEQPYSDLETKTGARNRARNAYYHRSRRDDDYDAASWEPDLAIGIEGGLEIDDNTYDCCTDPSTNSANKQHHNISRTDQIATTNKISKQLYCMAWIAIYGRRTEWTNSIFATMTECTSGVVPTTKDDLYDENGSVTKEVYGFSKTAMFLLPPAMCSLILDQGMELGHADDVLFRRTNSKQVSGTVGLLTNSIMDRTMYYEHAILLALIPWMHPHLYPNGHFHNIDHN